jgi:hypothetical protein
VVVGEVSVGEGQRNRAGIRRRGARGPRLLVDNGADRRRADLDIVEDEQIAVRVESDVVDLIPGTAERDGLIIVVVVDCLLCNQHAVVIAADC